MVKTEVKYEELAFESAELLPDRETMQTANAFSIAANVADISQEATSGAATATSTGGGDALAVSAAVNVAEVEQSATSDYATATQTYTP